MRKKSLREHNNILCELNLFNGKLQFPFNYCSTVKLFYCEFSRSEREKGKIAGNSSAGKVFCVVFVAKLFCFIV